MLFNKITAEIDEQTKTIGYAQIDFINSHRVYSILILALAAVSLYFFLKQDVDTGLFLYWICLVLLVDVFRLAAAISFHIAKNNNRVNYAAAELHLFIGTILSGLCWGSLAFIAVPVTDGQNMMIVLLLLAIIATISTTILLYRLKFAVIFVLLVLTPVLLSLPKQLYFAGSQFWLLEVSFLMLIFFLLITAKVFNHSFMQMLMMQLKLKQRENELIIRAEEAERANHARLDFMVKMSHELRTPMHAILGFSSLGRSKVGSATDEKLSGYFKRIAESGQSLLLLLNDLLDLSRLEAGKVKFDFSENDLQQTVKNAIKELNSLFLEHSLTIDIVSTNINTRLVYDNDKIGQVVRNILTNAVSHTPGGMNIMVYFAEAKLPSGEALSHAETEAGVSVSIRSQGYNIAQGGLDTVFDKTNSAIGGSGLGLAISREIIHAHGGVIRVDSNESRGVIFTFIVPRQ